MPLLSVLPLHLPGDEIISETKRVYVVRTDEWFVADLQYKILNSFANPFNKIYVVCGVAPALSFTSICSDIYMCIDFIYM